MTRLRELIPTATFLCCFAPSILGPQCAKSFLPVRYRWLTKDDRSYVDGEIVRQGVVGDQGDGAYSAGVRSFTFARATETPSSQRPFNPFRMAPAVHVHKLVTAA